MKFEDLDLTEVTQHPKRIKLTEKQTQLPLDQYFKTVANGDDFYGDSYNKILCSHYRIRLEDEHYHIDELDYSYSTSNFVSCWYNLVNGFTSNFYPISFCWSRTGIKFDTLEEAESHVVWLTNRRLETYNENYHKEPVNIVKHYW